MKSGEKNRDKELYRELRALPLEELWEKEVPAFDRATPEERLKRVSLIRAVGVVFSETGTEQQKQMVRPWLQNLLRDPAEKIRRYAMAALPKIGAGAEQEAELLSLLKQTTTDREKKFLGRSLGKIGGNATLETIQHSGPALGSVFQKVVANVARNESPSSLRMDAVLGHQPGLVIHLRGRAGLEAVVRAEVEDVARGKFRVLDEQPGLVAVTPTGPFSLGDLYTLRCFGTVGFVLGAVNETTSANPTEAYAAVIASAQALNLLETFTSGALRYRLEFVAKGHQRGAIRQITERAYALEPRILNDARSAPWAVDVHPAAGTNTVELRPRINPDPRLHFRQQDVPAASHPPLAACMARLGRRPGDDLIWDPFCGSGLELIESALLGRARKVFGTDLSEDAIAIAKANFLAAKLPAVESSFTRCDFRDFPRVSGLAQGSVSLIITNPPLGMRVPVPNLRQLIGDLFRAGGAMLKPGGRLVFANPVRVDPSDPILKLSSRRSVDFGGFQCQLEVYEKQLGRA